MNTHTQSSPPKSLTRMMHSHGKPLWIYPCGAFLCWQSSLSFYDVYHPPCSCTNLSLPFTTGRRLYSQAGLDPLVWELYVVTKFMPPPQCITHHVNGLLLDLLLCNGNRYLYTRWPICICTSDTFACRLLYCIGICGCAWFFDSSVGRNTCPLATMSWRTTCIRFVFLET